MKFHTLRSKTTGLKIILSLAFLLIFLAQTGLTFAHAHYKSSNIAPDSTITSVPAQLSVTFGEDTSPTQTKLSVTDASGKVVDKGDLKVNGPTATVSLGTLADGKYTVTFRTLTEDDGGIVNGSFNFTVAKNSSATAGTGKAQESETQLAAPATGLGGQTQNNPDNGNIALPLGLLGLSLFLATGLLVIRRSLKNR